MILIMNKLKALLMITIMLTTMILPSSVQAATVKISKAKATMEIDSTLVLKVTGTKSAVKWSTSKKSVATISTAGMVTAKIEGEATITATVLDHEYTCSITVVDSNKLSKTNTEPFQLELSQGEYLVGDNIPEGKCDLTGVSGWGFIYIYNSESSYEKDDWDKYILMCGQEYANDTDVSGLYSLTYSNLNLKKGYYLVIDKALTVEFKR
jgi:hypothetical protein